MNVGIRELKAKLSEYVALAANGESITITDRGKPVATIVSLEAQSNVARGIEEGWITPPTRSGLGNPVQHAGSRSVMESLDEDRGS
jgi:prevent-host-death family protein